MDGMSSRIFVALDHDDPQSARTCVDELNGVAERYKIGSVLFTRGGPGIVREFLRADHEVFLDLKFHDTPATVAGAVSAAAEIGVQFLTVHGSGGSEMIRAAREAAEASQPRPMILAITVLTSLDSGAYERLFGSPLSIEAAVEKLARLAIESGADGCVCAAHEAAALRSALGPEPLLVVPGIRPAWSAADHSGQARVATPAEALSAGASHLVVGRALTAAPDPREAFERIVNEIQQTDAGLTPGPP